jgi:hypothetical protein
MSFDFNQADEQRSFDVIPDGTIAVVQLKIRCGGAGEGGILTRSKDGRSEHLDVELVVVEGPHSGRKIFERLTVSGTSDGHAQAAKISHGKLRAILESALGIKPRDVSEAAKKARVAEYAVFDGKRFLAKIGVEPAKGNFKAKNTIAEVITPDRKEWRPIEQVPTTDNVIVKPAWAK